MRRALRVLVGAFAALLFGTLAAPPARATAVQWNLDPKKALDLARQEGRPILIDFWATWCGPCKDMEARLWSRPDIASYTAKFVCLRVDVDHHPEIADRFRTDSLPTVLLSDPWGTEIARRQGFAEPGEYLSLFKAMPADFSELAPWYARLATNRKDLEALRGIGLAYHRMKLFQTSTEFLEKALAMSELRAQPEALAEVLTVIGWNGVKTGHFKQAKKSFERCLKEVPKHKSLDLTVYGLFVAHLASGERQEAELSMKSLESCCPESSLVARARQDFKTRLAESR